MEDPNIPGSSPSDPPFEPVRPAHAYPPPPPHGFPQTPYSPPPTDGYAQTPYPPPGAATQGLSDTAAGAIAYLTIIPAIVFLVLAPYNTRPFIKFHSFQCLGLAVVGFCLGVIGIIPILGTIIWMLGSLALLIVWLISLIKASQGSYLKLPYLSDFAAQQSGYPIARV